MADAGFEREPGLEGAVLFVVLVQIGAQHAIDANGKVLHPGDAAGQARVALERIEEIVKAAGGTMDDIVRVRVYVTQVDSASLRDIHDVRSQFWTPGKYPASTLVRVDQLIRDGALIEIDADAVIPAP